jgi:hypothetical protein
VGGNFSAFELATMGYGFTMMNATVQLLSVGWELSDMGLGFRGFGFSVAFRIIPGLWDWRYMASLHMV